MDPVSVSNLLLLLLLLRLPPPDRSEAVKNLSPQDPSPPPGGAPGPKKALL